MPASATDKIRLGIIPLADCAIIAVAQERGTYRKYGLDVAITKAPSWASLRDQIMVGALDGAHMLAPMLLASTLGLGSAPFPMITGFALGLNGNAVTISNALYADMVTVDPTCATRRPMSARAIKALAMDRKRRGAALLTFATVFPFSLHNYLLRYWLAAGGIHPDRDVRLIVIPPPEMGAALAAGAIDGFCVGSPWNQIAVTNGHGRIAMTGYDLWNNAPEKVLGVSKAWADAHPAAHHRLLCALLETARWLDDPRNLPEAADILASPAYVGANAHILHRALSGRIRFSLDLPDVDIPDFHVFHRYAANFPWVSHAVWMLSQMVRWGQMAAPVDMVAIAHAVYQPALYRQAADALGLAAPRVDMKQEGLSANAQRINDAPLGSSRFFDDSTFDPARPMSYLEGFEIHSLRRSQTLAPAKA